MVLIVYEKEIDVPEGITATVEGNKVTISGEKGQLSREFPFKLKIESAGKKIKISLESERRKDRALVGTAIASIRNMIHGVTHGYTYKLKVIYTHFPVTIKVDEPNKRVLVENFLGENTPRVSRIIGDVKVTAKGADITVMGNDIDEVSQTAANLEIATKINKYDRKVFMDGIFITEKAKGLKKYKDVEKPGEKKIESADEKASAQKEEVREKAGEEAK